MEALAHFKLLNNFVLTAFLSLLISSCHIPIPKDVVNIDELPLKTTLKISSPPDIVFLNDSVTFTAQVIPKKIINNQPPTGTVTFTENETPLCSKVVVGADSLSASCTAHFLTPGIHIISAAYAGDNFYLNSTSDNFIQNISGKVEVKTELDISPKTPVVVTIGESVTLKANLIPDYLPVKMTGTLSFKDGETVIESCQFNDIIKIENLNCPHIIQTAGKYEFSAKYTPKIPGEHNFSVTYTGDVTYFDSQSESKKISVHQFNTSLVLSAQEGNLVRSSPIKLTAKLPLNLYEPKGTVSFYDNEIAVQNCLTVQLKISLENYIAECTVAKLAAGGSHTFKVKFSGDINNTAATTSTSRHVLIPTKASVVANPKNLWVGKDFVLNANIEASDNVPDAYISGSASFYDGAQILSDCTNLNVTNGKVECSVAQFNEPKSHSFSIRFDDKNTLKKYVSSLSTNYVASIDTQIPNSAIYLVTGTGKVSISTNGGRSWVDAKTQPTSGTDKVLNIFVTPIGDIYVGASGGNIYYSTDNGNVWNMLLPKINEPGSVIKALFINPNHELFADVTIASTGTGSIRKLKLNDPSRKWETLLPNFLAGYANAIVTFASPNAPNDTKVIVARNDKRFFCMSSPIGGVLTDYFQKEFTSMSLDTTATGRTLYLGTNTGEIYFLKDLTTSDFCPLEKESEKEKIPVILSSGTLGGLAVKGISVVSNTIYALAGSKVAISLDSGAHWEFRDTPDGAAANAIFVTPVLYAVAGSRISEQTDIQISKDSGKSWYSLKDNIGEPSDRVSLDTFFVTPQNGFMFTIFEGDGTTQIRTSTNGGLTWENREEFKSRYSFKASSLWVDTISGVGNSNSFNMNNLKFVVGYEQGGVGFSSSGVLRPLYNICMNPPGLGLQLICRVNSIQSSTLPNVVLTAAYAYKGVGSNGIEYFDLKSITKLVIPEHIFPVHSLAVNPTTNEWYESNKNPLGLDDAFATPNNNVIRKSTDGGVKWIDFVNYPYSGLPINLFTTSNGTLYVSFVSSVISIDDKNPKIYITTDDGNTWEQLTNQPYSGSQAASSLFAQYQYN